MKNTYQNNSITNKQTLYHFIVDRSGSMEGMENDVIHGFNTQVEKIQSLENDFEDQQMLCSLTFFNDNIINEINAQSVTSIRMMNKESYKPQGMTALLDAIGGAISGIEEQFASELHNKKISIVMIIITDGLENASRFYTYKKVAQKIAALDKSELWSFSFLGASFDAYQLSYQLNIRKENVMNFSKDNYQGTMKDISDSLELYACSKKQGKIEKDLMEMIRRKRKE